MITRFPDLRNKNVLITGGNGFLGKQICNAFLKQGSRIFVLDIKKPKTKSKVTFLKTNIGKVKKLYFSKKRIKIDILINGAAKITHQVKIKNKEKLD